MFFAFFLRTYCDNPYVWERNNQGGGDYYSIVGTQPTKTKYRGKFFWR